MKNLVIGFVFGVIVAIVTASWAAGPIASDHGPIEANDLILRPPLGGQGSLLCSDAEAEKMLRKIMEAMKIAP